MTGHLIRLLVVSLVFTGLIFGVSVWLLRSSLLERALIVDTRESRRIISALQRNLNAHHIAELKGGAPLDSIVKMSTYGAGVMRVKLFDRDAQLSYATDSPDVKPVHVDDLDKVRAALKGNEITFIKKHDPRQVMEQFAPLHGADGEIMGVAEVYFDLSLVRASIRSATTRICITVGLVYLLFLLLILFFSKSVFRRFSHAEAERLASEQRAAELTDLARTGVLIAGLAHQLRNPLGILKGATVALRRRATPELQPFVAAMEEESGRMERLVETFLKFASPTVRAGGAVPSASLAAALAEAAAVARQRYPALAISLPDGELPEAQLSHELLREVAVVLFLNSAEAAQPGSTPGVAVTAAVRDTGTALSFLDNGPGFPAEMINDPAAIQPFFTTKAGGTGLGLALAKKVIEEAGGSFRLRNGSAGGALVELEIPTRRSA